MTLVKDQGSGSGGGSGVGTIFIFGPSALNSTGLKYTTPVGKVAIITFTMGAAQGAPFQIRFGNPSGADNLTFDNTIQPRQYFLYMNAGERFIVDGAPTVLGASVIINEVDA